MYSEGFLQYLMSEELSKIDGINWLTLFVRDCSIYVSKILFVTNSVSLLAVYQILSESASI